MTNLLLHSVDLKLSLYWKCNKVWTSILVEMYKLDKRLAYRSNEKELSFQNLKEFSS